MQSQASERDIRKEVRMAVVMYGGVSLAIYINGVVQELFQMVRATATGPSAAPSVAGNDLRGGGRVYRQLGQKLGRKEKEQGESLRGDSPIRTRFVVDILSGTSAGGINAVYLAKALANGQDIEQLSKLWVDEGDIAKLLNDKESVKIPDGGLDLLKPPPSLLNGQRMYRKLLDAFDGMDPEESPPPETKSPFVEELDLFVTSTDFNGLPLPLRLFGNVIEEHRHRNVYRLRYTDKYRDEPHNDFVADNNPFLAFAARSTSAFPFAFAPIKLADIDAVLEKMSKYRNRRGLGRDRKHWQKFFPVYQRHDFTDRAFVDGGYLDNKPFGHAADAIASRSSGVPVDRKLLFIDPAPERPEDRGPKVPNAIENVAAVFTLPRYETIREDLQRILYRNRLIERAQTITSRMEDDVCAEEAREAARGDDGRDPGQRIPTEGVAYGGYHRLRVSAVSDEIAGIIARAGEFDPDSDEFFFINYLVRAWRKDAYPERAEHEFLKRFDLPYHLRRLNFVFGKIDQLYAGLRGKTEGTDEKETDETFKKRGVAMPETDEGKEALQDKLVELRAQLSKVYAGLYRTREELHTFGPDRTREEPPAGGPENPISGAVGAIRLRSELRVFLEKPNEEAREAKARRLVSENKGAFIALAKILGDYIKERTKKAGDSCRTALAPTEPGEGLTADARRLVWPYYDRYESYDLISFPILYATEVGEEMDPVEVARISPEDATSLIDERDPNEQRRKLAGKALLSFGAFFERDWRRNDILWGRLDGAERIITILLQDSKYGSEEKKAFIREAQYEILLEEFRLERPDPSDQDSFARLLADAAAEAGVQFAASPEPADPSTQERFLEAFSRRKPRRNMDPERAVRAISRSTTIVGGMLEGIAKGYRAAKRVPLAWIARLGRVSWGLIEVAVPQSLPNLLFRNGLRLLYLFEVLLIVGGTLLAVQQVQFFGILTLGITAALHAGTTVLGDFMRGGRKTLRLLLVLLIVTVSLGLVFLIAVGLYTLLQTELQAALLANLKENLRSSVPVVQNLLWLTAAALLVLALIGAATVFGLRKRLFGGRAEDPARRSAQNPEDTTPPTTRGSEPDEPTYTSRTDRRQ